ncbi:MAG: hypothetical protein P1U87_17090 [Verrucomicrobiales bacterium]|nr:hypothetical protein [Verrucomicrobiales bacterium]
MKGLSVFFAATFFLGTLAQAGWGWDKQRFHSAKSPQVEQRVTSPSYCFDAGWEFSGYLSGYWPEDNRRSNELGGGVALSYFLGHNFGFEAAYALHGGANSEQIGKFNAVYRFPLGGECCSTIAPYVFGGPGVISSGSSEMLWNVGGGLDFRLESWGCIGMFADFSYNWVDQGLPDFTQFRAGFKVPF